MNELLQIATVQGYAVRTVERDGEIWLAAADIAAMLPSFSFGQTAKILSVPGMGRNKLVKFLRQDGVLLAGNVPLQRYVERGYFTVLHQEIPGADGAPILRAVTQVSEKGIVFIRRRLDSYLRQYMERQMIARA